MLRSLLGLLLLTACDQSPAASSDAGRDAAAPDGGTTRIDAGTPDSGPGDAGRDAAVIRPAHLCVTSANTSRVLTFGIEQTGNSAPIRYFGDATELLEPGGVAIDSAHDEIFVTDRALDAVHVFARTAEGNVAPSRSIRGPATGLDQPVVVAIAGDEIFVGNLDDGAGTITVYSRTATGDAAPLRTLTGLGSVWGIAADDTHGELIVADLAAHTVATYARTASGAATPLRTIAGPTTTLASGPFGVAVDAVHDELMVTLGDGTLATFARTASGDVAPLRALTLPERSLDVDLDTTGDRVWVLHGGAAHAYDRVATGAASPVLSTAVAPDGGTANLAIDNAHGEVVVSGYDALRTYARATGALARTIQCNADGPVYPGGIASDVARGELWVSLSSEPPSLSAYTIDASGTASPLRAITGSATGLGNAYALALDAAHGELFVANYAAMSGVYVFALDATGDAAPARVITGPTSGLDYPDAVALAGGEVFVADGFAGRVDVFARDAEGDVAPSRTFQIAGATSGPTGMFADATRGELAVVYQTGTGGAIGIYALDATALHTVTGPATGLTSPRAVLIHPTLDEVWVTDSFRISVFAHDADGDVAPLRTIEGPATLLADELGGLAWCD